MQSWIEINRGAFEHNVAFVKSCLEQRALLGIVLKSNAYGHGLEIIGQLAHAHPDIRWFCVATPEEALQLRAAGCTKEILVMGPLDDDALLSDALRANIVVSIFDVPMAQHIAQVARKAHVRARVHIKLDAGMHRFGLAFHEVIFYWDRLFQLTDVLIEGIFAHMGNTNNPDDNELEAMVAVFNNLCRALDPAEKLLRHIGASGMVWSTWLRGMARVGTLLYGSWKSDIHSARCTSRVDDTVVPIMTWKTKIAAIKKVSQGECVGYDEVFCAYKPMTIAILPVGYADGYLRTLSGRGVVGVQGEYAPIVGVVSMNALAIDISHITGVTVGTEVILLGPYERLTPTALARAAQTNPNEITSSVRAHIPRRVVNGEDFGK